MSEPVRTCVGCRKRAPGSELLRVVARDGVVIADVRRAEPGRGAHLHRDPVCLALAERRRALPRALRVPGPLDLDAVRALVERGLQPAKRDQLERMVREQPAGPSLVDELLAERRRAAAAEDVDTEGSNTGGVA